MQVLGEYEREAGDTWPHNALENLSLLVQENALVTSLGECLVGEVVVFLLLVGNGGVHHHNVVLVMLVQVVDDVTHPVERETVRVQSHDESVSISTGGAAIKAIINTEVAFNKVGIIKTPNHPM